MNEYQCLALIKSDRDIDYKKFKNADLQQFAKLTRHELKFFMEENQRLKQKINELLQNKN